MPPVANSGMPIREFITAFIITEIIKVNTKINDEIIRLSVRFILAISPPLAPSAVSTPISCFLASNPILKKTVSISKEITARIIAAVNTIFKKSGSHKKSAAFTNP